MVSMKAAFVFFGSSALSVVYRGIQEFQAIPSQESSEFSIDLLQWIKNTHTRHMDDLKLIQNTFSPLKALSWAQEGYQSLRLGESKPFEPIWTPPRRETPEEEFERIVKRHEETVAWVREWAKYPLSNPVEAGESNVYHVYMDKRMEEYVDGDDDEAFLPDMGAPIPDYHSTSPYNKKSHR